MCANQQLPVHDAAAVVVVLEVRVGKARETSVPLRFAEVVGQMLHRIRSHHRSIIKVALLLRAQALQPDLDIQHDSGPDFHTQTEL